MAIYAVCTFFIEREAATLPTRELYIEIKTINSSRLRCGMEILFDRTIRDYRLSTVTRHIEILFNRTNRDSRLNTVTRHIEILFDRTNRDSRLNTVTQHM